MFQIKKMFGRKTFVPSLPLDAEGCSLETPSDNIVKLDDHRKTGSTLPDGTYISYDQLRELSRAFIASYPLYCAQNPIDPVDTGLSTREPG